MGEGWVGVTALARGIADERVSNRRRTRARASLAPGDDRSRDKAVANAAITTNRGTSVPPSGAARALHCGFVCHEAGLLVELDGGQHDSLSQQEAERSRFLQSEGYRVLRFWNDEVLENSEGVHAIIVENVRQPHP